MTSGRVFTPKRPVWLWVALAVAATSSAMYLAAAWWSPWRPGRVGGLIFGWLAVLLFVNAAAYPGRRRLPWPWGTAQQWLQMHIYGSTLASLFVLHHMGWRWPSGQMGWWLLLLSLWTAITGLIGVFLQKWVPIVLASNLQHEVLIAGDKQALDVHLGLQRLLRVWLVFHVPPAIALLGVVTVHVLAVWWY